MDYNDSALACSPPRSLKPLSMVLRWKDLNLLTPQGSIHTLQSFCGMLAYTYYPLEWEKVLFGDEVEIEMDTELLFNTSAVDGLIEFCWPLLDK